MSLSLTSSLSRTGKGQMSSFDTNDWFKNNHIPKETNRAIFTRQRDPIFENSRITQAVAQSAGRSADNILIFPRGINPMVSMQFTNADGRPAKLPHTILRDGAFRPPIRTVEQTTPLSRLPIGPYFLTTNATKLPLDQLSSHQDQKDFRQIKTTPLLINYSAATYFPPDVTPKYIEFPHLNDKLHFSAATSRSTEEQFHEAVSRQLPNLADKITFSSTSQRSDNERIVDSVQRQIPHLAEKVTTSQTTNLSDETFRQSQPHQLPNLPPILSVSSSAQKSNPEYYIENVERQYPQMDQKPIISSTTNPSDSQFESHQPRQIPILKPQLSVEPVTQRSNIERFVENIGRIIPRLKPPLEVATKTQRSNIERFIENIGRNIPVLKNPLLISTQSIRSNIEKFIENSPRIFPVLKSPLPVSTSAPRSNNAQQTENVNLQVPQLKSPLEISATAPRSDYDRNSQESYRTIPILKPQLVISALAPRSNVEKFIENIVRQIPILQSRPQTSIMTPRSNIEQFVENLSRNIPILAEKLKTSFQTNNSDVNNQPVEPRQLPVLASPTHAFVQTQPQNAMLSGASEDNSFNRLLPKTQMGQVDAPSSNFLTNSENETAQPTLPAKLSLGDFFRDNGDQTSFADTLLGLGATVDSTRGKKVGAVN